MGLFAHVALLEDAGEEVAVWAVGRPEVLGEGNEGRGRHGESIAGFRVLGKQVGEFWVSDGLDW